MIDLKSVGQLWSHVCSQKKKRELLTKAGLNMKISKKQKVINPLVRGVH